MGGLLDAVVVAILGVALLLGKVVGVVPSWLNIVVAVGFITAALLLALADFDVLKGIWSWSGWLLLVVSLVAFAFVNF